PEPYGKLFEPILPNGPAGGSVMVAAGAHEGPGGGADVGQLLARYLGAVRFVDDQLARLFQGLAARGVYSDNTLVIVTADHGESVGESGEFGHGTSLYSQQIHVPLIVSYPAKVTAGRRVSRVVEASRSILPTVLDLAGIPIPAEIHARSLLSAGESAAD